MGHGFGGHVAQSDDNKAQDSTELATPSPDTKPSQVNAMAEVTRIVAASSPAEVMNISGNADAKTLDKAWKRIAFILHPDKLSKCTQEDQSAAAAALFRVQEAREEFRESLQASGAVNVPIEPEAQGRPVCTGTTRGQRRFECRWLVPEVSDASQPVEKYEVQGPRIFAHTGEPMEWVLLATLPKREGCFIFVEESPLQQEVMWAGDRARSSTLPLKVFAVNGRGRSEALWIQLPWANKFPWLSQGLPSLVCRSCCVLQPRRGGEKSQCACGGLLAPSSAAVVVRCSKCHGEALWDTAGSRLDCRACGHHMAVTPSGRRQQPRAQSLSVSTSRH